MFSLSAPRPGDRWRSVWLLALWEAMALQSAAQGGPASSMALVWITSGQPDDSVEIIYAPAVTRETVSRDIAELSRRGAWTFTTPKVTQTRTPAARTLVEFGAPEVIVPGAGVLPLAPFIETLSRMDTLKLVFVTGDDEVYNAWDHYDDDAVSIDVARGDRTYDFTVRLKRHDIAKLRLPLYPDGERSSPVTEHSPQVTVEVPSGRAWPFLIGGAACIIGWILWSWRMPGRR